MDLTDWSRGGQLIYLVLALVLVASALVARQISFGAVVRMAFGWVLIFGIVILGFTFRPELELAWSRLKSEAGGVPSQRSEGPDLVLLRSADGHFYADGSINGEPKTFLIDSGASVVSISEETAINSGLDLGNGFPVVMETANGRATAKRLTVEELRIGDIVMDDITVLVTPTLGRLNVIGMNALNRLEGWSVKGDEMRLTAEAQADVGN